MYSDMLICSISGRIFICFKNPFALIVIIFINHYKIIFCCIKTLCKAGDVFLKNGLVYNRYIIFYDDLRVNLDRKGLAEWDKVNNKHIVVTC